MKLICLIVAVALGAILATPMIAPGRLDLATRDVNLMIFRNFKEDSTLKTLSLLHLTPGASVIGSHMSRISTHKGLVGPGEGEGCCSC